MARVTRYETWRYGEVSDLVLSTNSGRLALGEADGYDLTCGQAVSILLGGQWIDGCVEHMHGLYSQERTFEQVMRNMPLSILGGYFFVASDGNVCGLCVGMRVRLILG